MRINFVNREEYERADVKLFICCDGVSILNRYFDKRTFETIKILLKELNTQNKLKDDLKESNVVFKDISIVKNGDKKLILVAILPNDFDNQDLLRAGFCLGDYLKENKITNFSLVMFEEMISKDKDYNFIKLILNGIGYGLYTFNNYKSKSDFNRDSVVCSIYSRKKVDENLLNKIIIEATAMVDNIYITRDLINTPPNELTPVKFCEIAESLKSEKVEVSYLVGEELKKEGLNLIYSVGSGSEHKPAFLKIYYRGNPGSNEHVAIVGKGVTFDSGGTNLKPSGHIETMKTDMSGAAVAYAFIRLLNQLSKRYNVYAYIPLVENTIGHSAYRPGDVIKSKSSKTVEVLNTDAEGRLILADALTVASNEKPQMIVDLATLTGACVVALGSYCAAFFTNCEKLQQKIISSSKETGEDLWSLPLYKPYKSRIRSKIADLQNIATKKGEAGTIIAALFLKEFVDENIPWVHIDIAGTAHIEEKHPFYGEGASGFGLRFLYQLLEINSDN
jgi:leucyl aminopeptidase